MNWNEFEEFLGGRLKLTFIDNSTAIGNLSEILWNPTRTTVRSLHMEHVVLTSDGSMEKLDEWTFSQNRVHKMKISGQIYELRPLKQNKRDLFRMTPESRSNLFKEVRQPSAPPSGHYVQQPQVPSSRVDQADSSRAQKPRSSRKKRKQQHSKKHSQPVNIVQEEYRPKPKIKSYPKKVAREDHRLPLHYDAKKLHDLEHVRVRVYTKANEELIASMGVSKVNERGVVTDIELNDVTMISSNGVQKLPYMNITPKDIDRIQPPTFYRDADA